MDTKSKKFKIARIICFVLCLLLAASSGFAAASATIFDSKAGYLYSTDISFKNSLSETMLSEVFLDEIGFAYYAARRVHLAYQDGELFEGDNFKNLVAEIKQESLNEEIEATTKSATNLLKAYNELVAENLNSAGDHDKYALEGYWDYGYEYYSDTYDLSFSVDEVENSRFYKKVAERSYEIDTDAIYDYCLNRIDMSEYDMEKYVEEYEYLSDYLSMYSSLKYLIINSKTGDVFTNSPYKTSEDFQNAYCDNWFVASSNNFDTVTVSAYFNILSNKTDEYSVMSGDRAKDFNGKLIRNSRYLSQFFNSVRYGWHNYYNSSSYILGSLEHIEPDNALVYLSFDEAELTQYDPFNTIFEEYRHASNNIFAVCVFGIVSGAAALVLLIVLLWLAAKTDEKLSWQSKIPGEIHAFVSIGLSVLAAIGLYFFFELALYEYSYHNWLRVLIKPAFSFLFAAVFGLVANWLITVTRSIKGKVFFKRLIVAQPFRFFKKLIKKLMLNASDYKKGARKQLIIVLAVYSALSAICAYLLFLAGNYGDGFWLVLSIIGFILITGLLAAILYYYAKALDKITDTVIKTQQGDFETEFDSKTMPLPMVTLAQGISQMRSGMKIAVDSAVREQKAKMDLITNVSHDLKTPLTSIITYSDLIKRSGLADETVDSYADILVEKSFRLKHLIEDLTEATRVSTGAVDLQYAEVSLFELVTQALGENAEPLENKSIDVRLNQPENPPTVRADGQKTYRILENIISNIAKYAMPGTRAYVAVWQRDGFGCVSFKNISNDPLNIPADELMERFVRGDSARSGEGSGLGLSIARDLSELQGGKFEIQIDGDMFTATVSLPLVN